MPAGQIVGRGQIEWRSLRRAQGRCRRLPAPEDVMDNTAGAGDDFKVEAVGELVGGVPEPFTAFECDGGDSDVPGVDEVGIEKFENN